MSEDYVRKDAMSGMRLLEEFRRETPPISQDALRRAHERLTEAATETPSPTARPSRRRAWLRSGGSSPVRRAGIAVGLAGLLAVGLSVAPVFGPGGGDGRPGVGIFPAPAPANAAELVVLAAQAAESGSVPEPTQWVYLETVTEVGPFARGERRLTSRFWYRFDGALAAVVEGGRVHVVSGERLSGTGAAPGQAANQAGGQADDDLVDAGPAGQRALRNLADLRRARAAGVPPRPDGVPDARWPRAVRDFRLIGDALSYDVLTPKAEAALYRAIGEIPGVTVERGTVDLAGRAGIAFALVHEGIRWEIILDEDSHRFLGARAVATEDLPEVRGPVEDGEAESSSRPRRVAPAGSVLESTALLTRAVVDEPGDRG